MFRQFDRWIEGTNATILHDTGDGHGAPAAPVEMNLKGRGWSVRRQLKRRHVRFGDDLLVSRSTLRTSLGEMPAFGTQGGVR